MSLMVNIHEAKTHLARLLEQAHAGQEIILIVPTLQRGNACRDAPASRADGAHGASRRAVVLGRGQPRVLNHRVEQRGKAPIGPSLRCGGALWSRRDTAAIHGPIMISAHRRLIEAAPSP